MSDLGVVRYRKKPIVIEAIQWNGLNLQEIKNFVGDKCEIYDELWHAGIAPPTVSIKESLKYADISARQKERNQP